MCGEKVIGAEDRKLKHYVGEFINALTFADSKLWRTLKTILLAPGRLSHEFVEGRRKEYMKPVSIFFLANLIYFLFPIINTFTTNLNIQRSGLPYSDLVVEMVDKEILSRGISYESYQQEYDIKTAELSKLLLSIMATLIGVIFWPIHIGSKRNLIADQITVGQEVMTFILIYCLQLFGIIFWIATNLGGIPNLFSDATLTTVTSVALFFFFWKMESNFYGFKGIRRIVNSLLGVITIVIALFLYRFILFFVTFWYV